MLAFFKLSCWKYMITWTI